MSKSFSSLWMALGMLALLVAMFALVSSSQANQVDDAVAKGVAYLKTQGNDATKTMALVAAGQGVDVAYLKSFSGSTAIEYAKPVMAIAAAGENPATYAAEDLVVKLKSFNDGTQIGSASQVNDDIWGILALRAAGVSSSDSVIQNSKAFVLGNQNADGGWAWNVGGTSDTNDTAAAIMALLEAGESGSNTAIQKAVAYIKAAQNEDGGFPYDPHPSTGSGQADSDGNSDAWVIMLFNKLGEDISDVKNHLLSLQDADGGFWWMPPPAEFNNKGPTADAVIALSGKSYPVASFGNGEGDNGSSSGSEVLYRIVGSAGEICKSSGNIENALQVIIHGASECGYTYDIQDTSFGKYLAAINNDRAEGLNGWMYAVNGQVPSTGAADYSLSGGEQVVWFYGEFGDAPPSGGFEKGNDSVDLLVEIVSGGTGEGGDDAGNNTPEIAFSVDPSSLDFGQLAPGNSASSGVTLKNEGQAHVSVEVEVQGHPVFNFLKLDNAVWSVFSTLLSSGSQEEVSLQLAVPAGFNAFGQKQGTIIFWAQAQN